MAIGWNFKRNYTFKNEEFAKIYSFYVIETPVSDVSARGITFKSRNTDMRSLNAALKRDTVFLKKRWFVCAQKKVVQICKDQGILDKTDFSNEFIIHTINDKHCTGKTDSMFYMIRCAFAHGSFDIHKCRGDYYYILENRDQDKIKGRAVLRQETLLKWIDVVNGARKKNKGKNRN